jgi:hypothetical protein
VIQVPQATGTDLSMWALKPKPVRTRPIRGFEAVRKKGDCVALDKRSRTPRPRLVGNLHPENRRRTEVRRHLLFVQGFTRTDRRGSRRTDAPGRYVPAVTGEQRSADVQPEHGAAVIATAGAIATVCSQPAPQCGLGVCTYGVCAYADDARNIAVCLPVLSRFAEKIDTAVRPTRPPRVGSQSRPLKRR